MTLEHFSAAAWAALLVAAVLIGFSKTAVGGVAMVAVAIMASVLPARASTGVVLLLLFAGDFFAIRAYTRYADWPVLRALVPSVAVGMVGGLVFLVMADDTVVRRTIGLALLVLVLTAIAQKWRRGSSVEHRLLPTPVVQAAGASMGFASMVANAAVPLLSLYLLRMRLSVLAFLGTSSWFFVATNAIKVPISVAIGIVQWWTVLLVLMLIPALVVGAWVGRIVAYRISLATFEWVVYGVTLAAALNLVR